MSTETPRQHHQPRVERRPARPYAAIAARAGTEESFRAAVDRDLPALHRWAASRGLAPTGPPFIRYLVVDEDDVPHEGPPPATFECGVPLAAGLPDLDDGPVHAGELPAGRWLVLLHRGGHSGLARAHAVLHDWAARQGSTVDRRPATGGTAFGGAVEEFRVGPPHEPDPWRWETEVAYLLAHDDEDGTLGA